MIDYWHMYLNIQQGRQRVLGFALSAWVESILRLPVLLLVVVFSLNFCEAAEGKPATSQEAPKVNASTIVALKNPPQEQHYLAIVTYGTHASFDACIIGIRSGLQVATSSPEVKVINIKSDTVDDWSKYSLLVTIGSRATSEMLSIKHTSKILAVLLPQITYTKIISEIEGDTEKKRELISAIFLDQPVGRYLALINALAPQAKTVGVLLGPGADIYEPALDESQHLFQLQIRPGYVKDDINPLKALSGIIDRSDVLLALPDTSVYNSNTVPGLLLSSYRKGIPLIGFSRAYIRAGALTGIYTLPQELGYQTSQAILDIHNNNYQTLPAAAFPDSFDISVNYQVARSLGFKNIELNKLKQKIAEHVKGERF